MERPVKGDVVVVPFPFSDLSASKKRPALVAATMSGDDVILCQITSQARSDVHAILLRESDFARGKLPVTSRIRPNKLFTADVAIIIYKAGTLKKEKLAEVEQAIVKLFTQ